jgi:hypothetical protein
MARIQQGYVSKSIMDFAFHETYKLNDYSNYEEPAVFFGCYRYEDERLILEHEARTIVFLTGQDILQPRNWEPFEYCDFITAHPLIYKYFKREIQEHYPWMGDVINSGQPYPEIQLVAPAPFGNKVNPQRLGTKIYAYCPSSAPDYHGKKIIDELRCGGYEIVVGDGQFTQTQWKSGLDDMHYNQCFIGLCLSEFAGGGGSIIEMGLRGMKVVTNVFNLPNCIAWNGIHDVIQAIEDEKKLIGLTKASVARYTWDALDHKHEWLNI